MAESQVPGVYGASVQDLHLHLWPHQPGTPTPSLELLERYCSVAAAKGIDLIAITEHSHRFARIAESVLGHWERPRTGRLAEATELVLHTEGGADLDGYVEVLRLAQEQGLPILIGLEVDYLPGAGEAMSSVVAEYPFDILLGSVHWLDAWLFDAYENPTFAGEWEERDVDAVFAQYVDSVVDLAHSGMVDVLAHVDVIKVAGQRAAHLDEHERRLVEGIAASDMVVELSSAGLRKPVDDTYPSGALLGRLLEAGVELTTASDGHTADQVGWAFDHLASELDARGVHTLTTFSRRRPITNQR